MNGYWITPVAVAAVALWLSFLVVGGAVVLLQTAGCTWLFLRLCRGAIRPAAAREQRWTEPVEMFATTLDAGEVVRRYILRSGSDSVSSADEKSTHPTNRPRQFPTSPLLKRRVWDEPPHRN